MQSRQQRPAVAIRVATAIQHLQSENPGEQISIAAVCRLAEISRANLYENHSDLIRMIREHKPPPKPKANASPKPAAVLADEVRLLKQQVAALTLLCIEQRISLEAAKKDQERKSGRDARLATKRKAL